ncbi:hypothetical protein F8B43_5622 [Methylorubrum populi]|uniref:Uncharacterized protein n=1 Tax=Methylorubrum populi TaxID=223967 RepID=A0A833N1L8_9HYPH|nr:hypothetical protein F8B43_5622 [Methylorubrum populi]
MVDVLNFVFNPPGSPSGYFDFGRRCERLGLKKFGTNRSARTP